jgi:SAM-dependent methyltransferase
VVESLPDWVPGDIDLTTPSAARMYDYFLGGAHNFGVDRELARKVLEIAPDTPVVAQANRAFLHRAVRYLVSQGVRQFIDIGSGIPTEGNVHETAQREDPAVRVLYIDHDPVAVAHSELLLRDLPSTRVLRADLRRPDDILTSARLAEVIDLSQPVAVLMVAVLHFVPDDDRPLELISRFKDAVVPGSYLLLSHITGDNRPAAGERVKALYRNAADPITLRSRPEIEGLFAGWDLLAPGVVWVPQWRPDWPGEADDDALASTMFGGLGRKL